MEQNKDDAPTDEDDAIEVEAQTLRRLEAIRTPGESCDDILNRLLDDAVKNVSIEDIRTDLLDKFEDPVSINIDAHMTTHHEEQGMLVITVHTGKVGWEEDVSLYEGKEARAVIGSQPGEKLHLPFDIIATCDGPKGETIEIMPVYMANSVFRSELVTLEEGPAQLQTKIGKSNAELRETIYDGSSVLKDGDYRVFRK